MLSIESDYYDYPDYDDYPEPTDAEIEEQCRAYRRKQSYRKQFWMWVNHTSSNICTRYIYRDYRKIKHTKSQTLFFKLASRIEFYSRKKS